MIKKFLFILLVFCISKWNVFADAYKLSTEIEVRQHTQEIQSYLDAGKTRAQLWWYGWTGFYTGAAIFSFTIGALTDDVTQRVFQNVQGVESLVGAAGLLIFPFPARNASQKLKVKPENTPEEQTAKLKEAEHLLEKSAKAEIAGRSWLQHTLAFLVNATGSLVIWKGYEKKIKDNGDNPLTQALINFALGTAVAELQIWTQPTRAINDWNEYKKNEQVQINFLTFPQDEGVIAGAQFRF